MNIAFYPAAGFPCFRLGLVCYLKAGGVLIYGAGLSGRTMADSAGTIRSFGYAPTNRAKFTS